MVKAGKELAEIRVEHPVHVSRLDPSRERVQRIMRTPPRGSSRQFGHTVEDTPRDTGRGRTRSGDAHRRAAAEFSEVSRTLATLAQTLGSRPDQQRRRASPAWLLTQADRKPPSPGHAAGRRLLDCTTSSQLLGPGQGDRFTRWLSGKR